MRSYPATRRQLLSWIAADKRVLEMGHLPPARVAMLRDGIAENEKRVCTMKITHVCVVSSLEDDHFGDDSHSPGCSGQETHWRCTRPDVYASPNCTGHDDVSARQGHYVDACCVRVAARRVRRRLDRDSETIDVQVWT